MCQPRPPIRQMRPLLRLQYLPHSHTERVITRHLVVLCPRLRTRRRRLLKRMTRKTPSPSREARSAMDEANILYSSSSYPTPLHCAIGRATRALLQGRSCPINIYNLAHWPNELHASRLVLTIELNAMACLYASCMFIYCLRNRLHDRVL